MRSSIVKAVVAGSLLAGLSALPALAEFKLDGDPKVAMIIFGPKNDGGWCAMPSACSSVTRSLTSARTASRGSTPTADAPPE